MDSWGYEDYRKYVEGSFEHAVAKWDFSAGAAIGFAHSELTKRLDELPEEIPLALVALASKVLDMGFLRDLSVDDDFIGEVREAVGRCIPEASYAHHCNNGWSLFITDWTGQSSVDTQLPLCA